MDHQKALEVLCRVCGQRCVKFPASKVKLGTEKLKHQGNLMKKYKIDVQSDSPDVHPKHICKCCVASFSKPQPSTRPVKIWSPHQDGIEIIEPKTNITTLKCKTCEQLKKTSAGRRRKCQTIAAERRRESQSKLEEKEKMDEKKKKVEAACNIIINAEKEFPNKHLQLVATSIIKSVMASSGDDRIELPTGGPVSVI